MQTVLKTNKTAQINSQEYNHKYNQLTPMIFLECHFVALLLSRQMQQGLGGAHIKNTGHEV